MNKTLLATIFLLSLSSIGAVLAVNNTVWLNGYVVTTNTDTFSFNVSVYNNSSYIGLYNLTSAYKTFSGNNTENGTQSLSFVPLRTWYLNGSLLPSDSITLSMACKGLPGPCSGSNYASFRLNITYANGTTVNTDVQSITSTTNTNLTFTSNINHRIPIQKVIAEAEITFGGGGAIYAYVCNTTSSFDPCGQPYYDPGYKNLSLGNDNYTIVSNDTNYATTTARFNLSSSVFNFTFPFYLINTLSVQVFDELNNSLINDRNVSILFSGSLIGYNFTTISGNLTVGLLITDNYTVTYSAPGYNTRRYYLTLDTSASSLSLFLLPTSNSTLFQPTIQDVTTKNPVSNALFEVQKKNLSGTNYYLVEMCRTDQNGQCLISVQLYYTIYKAIIVYSGNEVYNSNDTVFATNAFTYLIPITTDLLQTVKELQDISVAISHDSSLFTMTYNDVNGVSTNSCLYVYKRTNALVQFYNGTCGTSASGTFQLAYDNSSGNEYIAKALFVYNSTSPTVVGYEDHVIINGSDQPSALVIFVVGLGILITFVLAIGLTPSTLFASGALALYLLTYGGWFSWGSGVAIAIICVGGFFLLKNKP